MVFRGLLLAAALLAPSFAAAQSYPDRPVKIVVPIGPAGSYDIVGRLLADQLSKRLGQSVVVENRPGAGTIVGTQAVINAPADGYTLLVGGLSNIVFNAGLYQKLPYDPLADLVPVALVFNISYTLVGQKGPALRHAQGDHRGGEEEPRRAQARQCRHRHRPAHRRRRLHEAHRHQAAGGSLPGIGGGVSRSAGRPRRPVLRFPRLRRCPTSSRDRRKASASSPPSAIRRFRTCRR